MELRLQEALITIEQLKEENAVLKASCNAARDKFACDPNIYHLIGNKCYFIDATTYRTWEEAQENCRTKFNGKGKLFEPRSLSVNDNVHNSTRPYYFEGGQLRNCFMYN